jgi:alkylhydroperoxidase/carboxymuconolactone decarboxylase family protein YurZ
MSSVQQSLRLLSLGDHALEAIAQDGPRGGIPRLDARTHALVRVAALIAGDAPGPSYRAAVDAARRSGARDEDLLGVVQAVVDLVGTAKIVSAAPLMALAMGYDAEAALE